MYLDNQVDTLQCHSPGSCKNGNPHSCNPVENLDSPGNHLQKGAEKCVSDVRLWNLKTGTRSMKVRDYQGIIRSLPLFFLCPSGGTFICLKICCLWQPAGGREDGPLYGTEFRRFYSCWVANTRDNPHKLKSIYQKLNPELEISVR